MTRWEPPHRLDHSFTLAQAAEHPNSRNVSFREKLTDWPVMLDRFAALAEGR